MRTADRTLARRYARALFAAAAGKGREEVVAEELRACAGALASARGWLGDPRVPLAEKKQLVAGDLADRISELTADFLRLLIDRKRFDLLPQAAEDFSALLRRKRGVARALVFAARPLPEADRRRLRQRLESFAGCGVELEMRLDPDLLGGLRVRLGDWVLDNSLRGQLRGLKEAIGGD
ncbi:MAG: ATP synthase F1 subunit delta [Elusimicrobia bacterium]|nr:ATP synthase F1 subunit delta [Elusimicrobiota bacterium]